MMRKMLPLALAATAAFAQALLPAGEAVMERFVEVTGGRAAYEARKSEAVTGRVEFVGQGVTGTVTAYSAPGLTYLSMDIEGVGKIEQGMVNGVAWERSAMMGARVKEGEELEQTRRDSQFNAPIRWKELYASAETKGVETVEGEECYKVVLTPKGSGKPETLYFSKASGFMVKRVQVAVSPLGEIPAEQILSDYKDFGGVKQPGKMVQKAAGQQIAIYTESVVANAEIPADKRALPPEIEKLLAKQKKQ
jgi:hypothetical protein